jgi:transmembrane sensor
MLKRSSATSKKLTEAAIKWFLKIQNTEPDHPERGQFEAWLMANPAHSAEFNAVAEVWEDFDSKANLQSLASAVEQKQFVDKSAYLKRKQKVISNVLGIAFIGILSWLGLQGYDIWQTQPIMQIAQVTKVGEQLEQVLEDGSTIFINGNSDLSVTYSRSRRFVKLNRGEVIFNVAKDPSRPFVIDSGYAKVTVLGTRFVVNRMEKLVRVSVDHGRVRVESVPSTKFDEEVILHDGQVAEIGAKAKPVIVNRDASEAFAFKSGVLNFENAGLDEIAEVLSRYRKPMVQAKLLNTQNPHVTAVVNIYDIERFLENLQVITSVAVINGRESTVLVAQPPPKPDIKKNN